MKADYVRPMCAGPTGKPPISPQPESRALLPPAGQFPYYRSQQIPIVFFQSVKSELVSIKPLHMRGGEYYKGEYS